MVADICIRPWDYRVEPFCIVDGLYYVGNRNVSSHLIDTGEGLVLLDTAFPQTVYLLLEAVRRLGFDPDEIRTIVHSHGHYDHFGGTRALVELTGARTALGRDDLFILTERPELSWAPEYGVEFHETFSVDLPLDEGQRFRLGWLEIECVHIPGHTPGSMALFFTLEHGGTTQTVGIHGGPGLNTLSDAYLTMYGLSADARHDYMASLEKLQKRHVDIFIGAHPDQNDTLGKRGRMSAEHNPFVDDSAWPQYLRTLERSARAAFGLRE